MNLSEFIKSKNERFSLLYALYLILYFILVLGIDIDFILYYIITALIAAMLALITIIFQLEVIVDNFFFGFRKKVDMNIFEILKIIWKKSLDNSDCKSGCNYLKNTTCNYNFDILDIKVQLICMNKAFYPIINSDEEFNTSKSFIYQGFLNYYICIIILIISVLSPFFVNLAFLTKINEVVLANNVKRIIITSISIQLYCFLLIIIFQIVRYYTKEKGKTLRVIFGSLLILIFLLYYFVSIYLIILTLKLTSGIYQNSILIYLSITTLSLILSLISRRSKRVKDYILQNQELQLDKIIDVELKDGSVSKRLQNAICQDAVRKKFYDSRS